MIQIKNYPKAHKELKIFLRNLLNVWVKQAVNEDINDQELTEEYLDQIVDTLTGSQPRLLYDFLDEKFIYLQPHLMEQLAPEKGWGFELSTPNASSDELVEYPTRKEAEAAGFEQAFKILERLL